MGKGKQTPAVPRRIEVTIVARYDDPWPNERSEVAGMRNGGWNPSTKTFRELASVHGLKSYDCEDFDSFMGAILDQPDGTVSRVNLITHGGAGVTPDRPGFASLGGYIELNAAKTSVTNVFLGALSPTDNRPAPTGIDSAKDTRGWLGYRKLDSAVVDWLNDANGVGPTYREMLRKKFRSDAEIILYACHAGLGTAMLLLQDLAQTLLVTARGFRDEVRFDTTFSPATPTKGERDRVINRHATHYPDGGASADGFKHLVPDKAMPRPATRPATP